MMTKPKLKPRIDITVEQIHHGTEIAEMVDRKIASGKLTDYEKFLKSIGQLRPYLIGRAMRRG